MTIRVILKSCFKVMLLLSALLGFIFFARETTLIVEKSGKYPTLKAAVANLQSGDRIIVRAGTYLADDSIRISNLSHVNITGEDGAIILCRNTDESVLWFADCEDLTLSRLHIRHSNPSFDISCTGNVISLESCTNLSITQCEIDGCGATGIYANDCSNLLVKDNYIHDNTRLAFNINSSSSLTISHNKIEYNGGLFNTCAMEENKITLQANKIQYNADYSDMDMLFQDFMNSHDILFLNGKLAFLRLQFVKMADAETVFLKGANREGIYLKLPTDRRAPVSNMKEGAYLNAFFTITKASADSSADLSLFGEMLH